MVKRATTVEVGTDAGDQLAAVSQAPPFAPCHVFVVCACTCGAASNASVAMSNGSIRKSGVLVFMGLGEAGVGGLQLAVSRKGKSFGRRPVSLHSAVGG